MKIGRPPGVVCRHVTVDFGHGLYMRWWTMAVSEVACSRTTVTD